MAPRRLRLWCLAAVGWLGCSAAALTLAERNAERVENSARQAALARSEVAAEAIEQNLLRLLEGIQSLDELAQTRQRLRQAGALRGLDLVEQQLRRIPESGRFGVLQVAMIGNDGYLAWSSAPFSGPVYLGDREHFRMHQGRPPEIFVSAPLIGRVSGQPSLQFTQPMLNPDGSREGVLVVSVDPRRLSDDLTALSFGERNSAIILRRDGTVLASGKDAQRAMGEVLPPQGELMQAMAKAPGGAFIMTGPVDGREKLIGYRLLEGTPLAVCVSLDAEQEMAATAFVRPSLRATALAFSVLLLAALALALLWLERRRTLIDLEQARREREAAQQRLLQSQRMEALGRLAGGVAHDFNNVLQAVLGGAKLLAKRPGDEASVRHLSRLVLEAAERGASVTRRLLTFARRVDLNAAPVALEAVLPGLREVLVHTIGREVRIELDIAPNLPAAMADRSQLETVLINLAINARDAMHGMEERRLTFLLRDVVVPGPLAGLPHGPATPSFSGGGPAPGRYVSIAVADTGSGMDAATLAQAMEPFFTTKPKGKGTGLGLAMAKGFAEQSGGALAIRSQVGEGTVVTLWLPVAPLTEPAPAPRPEPLTPGSGHILLVDDEAPVRLVLAASLREHGYSVTETAGGPAALAYLDHGGACDALVSDLAMPDMDGLTLLRLARRRRRGVPAVLITGYTGDAAASALEEAAGDGALLLLRKPIDPEELVARLAALLQGQTVG